MARPARLAAAGLLVAALVGYGVADVADVVPGPLTDEARPTAPPWPPAAAATQGNAPAPAVLAPATGASLSPDALAAVLDPLVADPALGSRVGVRVVDGATGAELYRRGTTGPQEPASTAKLLTAAAALAVLGPDERLVTRVVRGAAPGEVVLVGGGDVLLSGGAGTDAGDPGGERAGLRDLAAATARALGPQATGPVRVRLDDRLFTGPDLAPGVTAGDVAAGFTAPIAPLAVDAGRTAGDRPGPRSADPALAAATRFARLLADRGVPTAGEVTRAAAPAGAETLATVRSAPAEDVVAHMLATSDNVVADALAHVVAARTGAPATFAGSGRAVVAAVAATGVDTDGVALVDGSGLGEGSRLPVRVLTDVLVLAASRPQLRPLLAGLPVAGLEGTLAERFAGDADAGAGLVRAKTGTLTGTTGLAGTSVTREGDYVAFAVLADAVPATPAARQAVDDLAAALTRCGCR